MIDGPFDDGKEADALRTIGELGRALGLKPHVLRYWEEQFPMLKPLKRSGGRRYYRAEDVELVQTIDRLVNEEGYTLKGARTAIESGRAGLTAGGSDSTGEQSTGSGTKPRYLTARDLPGREEETGRDTGPPLRRASDAARLRIVEELKDIRAALAEAIAE